MKKKITGYQVIGLKIDYSSEIYETIGQAENQLLDILDNGYKYTDFSIVVIYK